LPVRRIVNGINDLDPSHLLPFQHEEVIQLLLGLAEKNKVLGYSPVTIADSNKFPPKPIDRGRYGVYEVLVEQYPNTAFAAKFIPEDALDTGTTELCEFNRDATCLRFAQIMSH
jgi:hypothetical protein